MIGESAIGCVTLSCTQCFSHGVLPFGDHALPTKVEPGLNFPNELKTKNYCELEYSKVCSFLALKYNLLFLSTCMLTHERRIMTNIATLIHCPGIELNWSFNVGHVSPFMCQLCCVVIRILWNPWKFRGTVNHVQKHSHACNARLFRVLFDSIYCISARSDCGTQCGF